MLGYVLTVERTIPTTPQRIFDVLADPAQHSEIDGSGMLQGERPQSPSRLALGTKFGMSMKMLRLRYATVNRVVEFETNRRIAWQTGPEGFMARLVAGRIWRYQLEPVEGGTLVRQSWDITPDHQRVLLKLGDIYSGAVSTSERNELGELL